MKSYPGSMLHSCSGVASLTTPSRIQLIPESEEGVVSFEDFDHLPHCVADYFSSVLKEGDSIIRNVSLRQIGELRMKEEGSWYPFEAEQNFTTDPVSFDWKARIEMCTLRVIQVHDSYADGIASMQAKFLGMIPLVGQRGTAELKAAALQRYLAEAAWFPTALLPNSHLRWLELDHHRALATLRDEGVQVSLEFDFNEKHEIAEIYSTGRYSYSHGKYELIPWAGCFHNYEIAGGVRIPMEAEVEWIYAHKSFPYFKGRITDINFHRDEILRCESCC
jgi:hypothetical protein